MAVESSPLARRQMLTKRIHNIAYALQDLDKPVICALNGTAVGAKPGYGIDVRHSFCRGIGEVQRGIYQAGLGPGDGGCYYLPRLVGSAKALEMLWTGDTISASEAEAIGMVNRVVPDDELQIQVQDFARKLCLRSPVSLGLIKRWVYQGLRSGDLQMNLDLIASHMGVVSSLEDTVEALAEPGKGANRNLKGR